MRAISRYPEAPLASRPPCTALKGYADAGVLHGNINTLNIMSVEVPEGQKGFPVRGLLLDLDPATRWEKKETKPVAKETTAQEDTPMEVD